MIKAIVTGHSRGLGAAITAELLARGIPVLGLSRAPNGALAGAAGFAQCELDLADASALEDWLAGDTLSTFVAGATCAVLINNAGAVQPVGPLETQAPADVMRAVSLNVAAPLALSAAFATATANTPERRIVHISSGAARNPFAGWSVYCATKAALDMHARAVAADQPRALRICSIAPGVVDTDMQAEIRATDAEHFPAIDRFRAMKRDGALTSAQDCARAMVAYTLGESFAGDLTPDIRTLSAS